MSRMMAGLITVLAISVNTGVSGTLINLEEAAEVSRLEMRLDGANAGRIYARMCDDCELLTLRANNETRITRGRELLSLDQAAALKNKGATVLFDPSTRQITRILFWN